MADYLSAAAIRDSLTICTICTKEFDETTRIPRRMPCCVRSICQPCLENCITDRQILSCPRCRHQHHLPDGIKSLPKEPLVLKILDHLKIQKGLNLPCTDCPDEHHAVARCDDCCIFLCQECLNAHRRTRPQRDHITVTFEEMKGCSVDTVRRSHQCAEHKQPMQFYCHTCSKVICVSGTVVDHKEGQGHNVVNIEEAHQERAASIDETMTKLEGKIKALSNTFDGQTKKMENIKTSKKTAEDEITETFDNLIEELQLRRAVLLSEVEARYNTDVEPIHQAVESTKTILTKSKSSFQYIKEIRPTADKVEDLQLMVFSADPLNAMLNEKSQDVEFDRTGVSFVPANVQQLSSIIQASGLVRTVRYSPTAKPSDARDLELYNTVTFDPIHFPEVAAFDELVTDRGIYCPHLEWDTSTASHHIKITKSVISNTRSYTTPTNTGCRLQGARYVLASKPLVIKKDQRILYQIKSSFVMKSISPEGMPLFESALVSSVVDAQCNQRTGLSVRVLSCSTHKRYICLKVCRNNVPLCHVPINENRIGVPGEIHICFLICGTGKIHVIDAAVHKLMYTITDLVFDKLEPLWIKMYVDAPTETSMTGELLSGNRVTLSAGMKRLLRSLCE